MTTNDTEARCTTVADVVRRTRAEQGLPPQVEDGTTLARIADLFRLPTEEPDT